jgi:DNA-binding NtrC family response regulator
MEHKIKLLIVDDEERFLQTLSKRLGMRDFDVTPVTRGEQAVQAAREQEFDLALVDLKMPGMDGDEVLRILKQEHPLMEVIILTGHGSIESAVEATQAGSFRYLQKPAETDELHRVLKEAYQQRVQRKHELSDERLGELMQAAESESPLAILRRLKEIERRGG